MLTHEADLRYEQNRLQRIQEIVTQLGSGHDDVEREAFALLRQLLSQAAHSMDEYQENIEGLRKNLEAAQRLFDADREGQPPS